ncbi:MAG TPA: Rid family hydrolase [Rhodocyclaceae bacterium]|nr:Rid family hydrolase [Rhodocyclaceae bacterium]
MTEETPVAHSQLSPPQLADLTDAQRQRLLGVTCIGGPAKAWHGELPVQNVAAPLLGRSAGALNEVWYSAESCRSGEFRGIRFRVDDNVLYGVVDVEEGAFRGSPLPLQHAAEDAYGRIFALLDREGYAHLWRAWNYLSEINVERDGLERYRQFNIGRYDAFVASGRLAQGRVPAACALGTPSGPLTIAFMAGRSAPTPIENPRQVSAYNYPASYGPRSPTFSRAAFATLPGQELLFISGTASIVGHRTLHIGDVAGQTRETLANIAALLGAANAVTRSTPYMLAELSLRAYIRHAEDYPLVQAIVEEQVGRTAPVVYVQADICRADLLVEIEAMASHPMGSC